MLLTRWPRTTFVGMCMVLLAALVALPSHAQPAGPNLLVDGDFESPAPWPMQDGIGEVQVAPSWRAWYLDLPPSYVEPPGSCYGDNGGLKDTGCFWMRPEFRDTVSAAFPNRVRSGIRSQKYFSFGRMHEGGLLQQVSGVTPGTPLRFSIYMQAWMCHDPDACGKYGEFSDAPANMHLRVGIDPYGGTNPFDPNIIWSPEQEAFDRWVEFSVQATAQAYAVTVFTHSRAEWDWARKDNDVYLDDASLVQVSASASPLEASPTIAGTPAPTSPPAATRTPLAGDEIIHIVQEGDTLYGISLEYDVPLDELYSLNNLSYDSFLYLGQPIIVRAGKETVLPTLPSTATPQPTGTADATPTPLAPATPTLAPPTPTSAANGLCLGAYEDKNGNGVRDGNESSLAGVTFVIAAADNSELEAHYATDGMLPSYCLATLPPSRYSVLVRPPSGYVVALDSIEVMLAAGQHVDLQVAAQRGEESTPTPEVKAPPQAGAPPARTVSNLALVAGVIVVGILLVVASLAMVIVRGRS